MGRLLMKKGHRVSFAEDGEDFIRTVCTATKVISSVAEVGAFAVFDVVLVDRHMPKLEGPEATRCVCVRAWVRVWVSGSVWRRTFLLSRYCTCSAVEQADITRWGYNTPLALSSIYSLSSAAAIF